MSVVWTMSLNVYWKNNVSSKGSAFPQLLSYTKRIVYYWFATYILKNNIDAFCSNFSLKYRNSANIWQHLTVFPSYFNNIYLKYFRILQNLMKNYKILQKLTKVYKSWWKVQYSTIFFWSNHLLSFCFIQFQCTVGIS